ncbi:hypothetical protein [Xanthomonas axonopodis]|uniref:hypothetical protein n=1 Tax=Xanthomonas axonopodis TaxID=53413 RepID=UPI00111620B8|nr:hypothetical protein [Xanthomonas axonopodis]
MSADTENGHQAAKRGRSGTTSPYFDLDMSVKVAEVIHSLGGGHGTPDQVAAWLKYKTTKSGTFLTRVGAAKQFGLIASNGKYLVPTERAMTIVAPVMPDDAINAKADAFLAVDLFSKVYEQFRGSQLPSDAGLKNLFASQSYAILQHRIDQAIRVFRASAAQAGFFLASGDQSRLIRPTTGLSTQDVLTPAPAEPIEKPAPERPKASSSETAGVHSAIVGLLRELPPSGTEWSAIKKKKFS